MRTMLMATALGAALLASGVAAAADSPIAAIRQFVDGIDKGDMKMAADAFAPGDLSIIDVFPPHYWHGPDAFNLWLKDFGQDAARHGDTDAQLRLAEPTRMEVSGERAYVVAPAVFAFKRHGAPMVEHATMTFTAVHGPAGWRVDAWSYGGTAPEKP